MSIYYNKYKYTINEAYFNNPKVKEMENCIERLRQSIQRNKVLFKKFNTLPDVTKFNRLTEDIFEFRCFSMNIIPMYGVINAYTIPISNMFDVEDPNVTLRADKNGFKYSNTYSVTIAVYSDLFTSKSITTREVMAIILHEIGHNFQDTIINKDFTFVLMNKMLLLQKIIIAAVNNPTSVLSNAMLTSTNMTEILNKLGEVVNTQLPTIKNIDDNLRYLISLITYIPMKIINVTLTPLLLYSALIYGYTNPMAYINKTLGYNDEKVSDSFATMYGYGADLSSILIKMTHKHSILTSKIKIPVVTPICGLFNEVIHMILTGLSPHPNTLSRVNTQLDYLRVELETNCDPKMRKEIESQIQIIEKLIDTNIVESRKIDDYHLANKVYLTYMNHKFGDKNPLDKLLYSDNHKKIQTVFDRVKMR